MPKPSRPSSARRGSLTPRSPRPSPRDPRGLPTGKNLSATELEELRRVARDYPFVLFGCLQLAALMEVHPDLISAVANHRDTPFLRETKKARPEWVLAFLQKPPSDFTVK